ncbi:methyltransferase [Deinococcus sp.]|uniref:methyltransferase family protein n=1 Tax=Deinococcus sp. TaxID=47478 RepID=UPI0025E4D16B|nr:methyltransferase [Deinococcus sp.]
MITLAVILGGVVWLVMHAYLVDWDAVKVAGAVVAGVALVLLVVARLQLGGSFAVKAKAKKLVTTGLYSRIRNPIYVFGAMLLVGMSVVLGNWVLLGLVVVLMPLQAYRARKEEAVLAAAFGEEYVRYKAGTWF